MTRRSSACASRCAPPPTGSSSTSSSPSRPADHPFADPRGTSDERLPAPFADPRGTSDERSAQRARCRKAWIIAPTAGTDSLPGRCTRAWRRRRPPTVAATGRRGRGAGISVVVPTADDRELVDRVVFDELTKGVVTEAAQRDFVRVVAELAAQGAQAVVLACTEIEVLFRECAAPLPLVDSMDSHAAAIADYLLTGELPAPGRVQAPAR
ncbi:aspartate/glutamate racemase family protein [Marihabitans asiaticum]|uniref:aspartate/glutamate racemase family protein n=1 Tax=Marihabitans asiaticum TaxID=415218 RepID=UPI0011A91743|nr:aspartate/glutamate racemase family protein [Marihabitans asiaticum]